jgi:hypothetical protein
VIKLVAAGTALPATPLAALVGLTVVVADAGSGSAAAAGQAAFNPSDEAIADNPAPLIRLYVEAAASCAGLPWQVLAGIGEVESNHGRNGGATVRADGQVEPPIIGIPLNGTNATAAPVVTQLRWLAHGLHRSSRECPSTGLRAMNRNGHWMVLICGAGKTTVGAMAHFIFSGSWMSFSSTRVTMTPQSSVATSRISRMLPLMRSVSPASRPRCVARRLAQGGLGDLADRRREVLDGDDGFGGVDDPVVGGG